MSSKQLLNDYLDAATLAAANDEIWCDMLDISDEEENNLKEEERATEWDLKVNQAIYNLQRRGVSRTFTSEELFFRDGCRCTVKAKMVFYFEIFPWCLPPLPASHRYRESLAMKKGETINAVTDSLNFFLQEPLNNADLACLKEYYLINGPPQRFLWAIIEVKEYLLNNRLFRQRIETAQNQQLLDERLNQSADMIKKILLLQESNPLIQQKLTLLSKFPQYSTQQKIELLEFLVS